MKDLDGLLITIRGTLKVYAFHFIKLILAFAPYKLHTYHSYYIAI